MPQRSTGTFSSNNSSRSSNAEVPDGWFRISGNNAHPLTPPNAARHSLAAPPVSSLGTSRKQRPPPQSSSRSTSKCGPGDRADSLGLAHAADPMRMLLRETRVKEQLQRTVATSNSNSTNVAGPTAAAVRQRTSVSDAARAARSSPRHLKLLREHAAADSHLRKRADASVAHATQHDVAEAFSPLRSLRLASLRNHSAATPTPDASLLHPNSASHTTATASVLDRAISAHVPLHELIQHVDDAVDANPRAPSSEAAVTQAFLHDWLAQYDASRHTFKSIAVHAEVGLRELARLTANVRSPNAITTTFVCKLLQDVAPHFGAYAALLAVLCTEVERSIYVGSSRLANAAQPPLSYFAAVKHQRQLVIALQRDKTRREARNVFLSQEIVQVHSTFYCFLDACSFGLVRTIFREWYSIAIVRKKNSKKYIEYFSAWFTGSAKALIPKLFVAWKHVTLQHKVDAMQTQLRADAAMLVALQRQIDDLSVQRDAAHVESVAIRTDRKVAEDLIARLNRKIQSAGVYLEGSYRRESIVCQEGQLRVEAVAFLPPLVLESLLRAFHSVGYCQQHHNEFLPPLAAVATAPRDVGGVVEADDAAALMPIEASAPLRAKALLRRLSTVVLAFGNSDRRSDVDNESTTSSVSTAVETATTETNESTQTLAADNTDAVESVAMLVAAEAQAPVVAAPLVASVAPLKTRRKLTVLQEVVAEIANVCSTVNDPPVAHEATSVPSGLSLQRFSQLFTSIRQRMDAADTHVLFTRNAVSADRIQSNNGMENESSDTRKDEREAHIDDDQCDSSIPTDVTFTAQETLELFEQTLAAIRVQDEHYARHAKLFSARLLENHEVSVIPMHWSPSRPATATAALSDSSSSSCSSSGGTDKRFETTNALAAPTPAIAMLPSSDVGLINGASRYAIADVCPIHLTPLQLDARAAATAIHVESAIDRPSNASLERLALMSACDWKESIDAPRHARACFALFVAHVATEFGSLLFSPADMSAFMHHAFVQHAERRAIAAAETTKTTTAADASATSSSTVGTDEPTGGRNARHDQGYANLVIAYDAWNRLTLQMIDAEIVQVRGGGNGSFASSPPLLLDRPGTTEAVDVSAAHCRTSSVNSSSSNSNSSDMKSNVRPKLQCHVEPLPQGILLTAAAKERESTSASGLRRNSQARLSITSIGETFHAARIRKLSIESVATLTHCVENIHSIVQTTSSRLQDFHNVQQQLRELRHVQWEQANDLASQCATTSSTLSVLPLSGTETASNATSVISRHDERKHVFACVSFVNPVIERIFSIEDNPVDELERVRERLERAKDLVRMLYTKQPLQTQQRQQHAAAAVSLDDLWHFVKVLRFPKPIHMLPAMRDVDSDAIAAGIATTTASSSNEQLFSPDDLAEILLQLCNEQFLPYVTPLSARVEVFVKHHLPLLAHHPSIVRATTMQELDVKRALGDHARTLRIIFRRYCAKEPERAATATGSGSRGQQLQPHRPVRHASHGITKFMRLSDWLAFLQDYNLLRPRFSLDYAINVFRNVLEVASASVDDTSTAAQSTAAIAASDESLAMIYSEFCEALVGAAACYFPDPFVRHATKLSQFIQRFVPVVPEEVASHSTMMA